MQYVHYEKGTSVIDNNEPLNEGMKYILTSSSDMKKQTLIWSTRVDNKHFVDKTRLDRGTERVRECRHYLPSLKYHLLAWEEGQA